MEIITVLMTAATVALAGIGGLYYSFACSVMPGLRATDDENFVCAMTPGMLRLPGSPLSAPGRDGTSTAPGCRWLHWWHSALAGLPWGGNERAPS